MTSDAGGKAAREGGAPPVTERITIALVRKAGDDLQKLQDRTGLSKTDLVNRAISVYEFIESNARAGNDLLVRDKDGEIQILRFI